MSRRFPLLASAIALAGVGNAGLAQEATQLDTVVVTAAGFEQNIADAPASISVITREELDKRSYTDVLDAVKNIPGVYTVGGGNADDVSIRGMARNYTLYMIDGRPISAGRNVNTNGADAGKQIALPPLSMIERIEVIRGPMSSLYGSEAMGGVINIITRKGGNEWRGSVSTEYTHSLNDISNDEQQANFYVGGPLVKGLLGLQVNGSYLGKDESDFVGGEDTAESTPETKRKTGGVELYLTPDEQNRFAVSYQSSTQETVHTPGKSALPTATTTPYEFDKDVYVVSHDGRYDNLVINTYFQHDISDKVQDLTKKETVNTFNTQASYFWGNHTVTFGGQYKKEKLTNETNGILNITGLTTMDRWIGALFTEIDWAVTDDLSVTTGLRYNDDELFGGHLSPRAYAVYHLTPDFTLKGGVSTGYRQPTLTQVTEGFGTTTGGGDWRSQGLPHARGVQVGNPDLDPETSINYEVGFAYSIPSSGFSTSLMLFQTQFKDKITEFRECSTDATGDANRNNYNNWTCQAGGEKWYYVSKYENVDEAEMTGVEVTIDYDITAALAFRSSYTYTDSEQKSGENKGQPLNKTPKHMVNAILDWQTTDRLTLWLQGNYRSETSDYLYRTEMKDGTPGYGFVDAGLVYRLTDQASVKAGLYNIANKEVTNEDYEVVLDGRRFNVGLTVNF